MPKGYPQGQRQTFTWSSEMDQALREFVGEGHAYSKCRNLMNAKFNRSWTRSAIIGRAGRLDLKSRNPQYLHQMGAERKSRKGTSYKKKGQDASRHERKTPDVSNPAIRSDAENRIGMSFAQSKKRASAATIAERRIGVVPDIVAKEKPATSKHIMECTGNECRWPTSTDLTCMEVCGAPSTFGAYCEEHGSRAYRIGMTNGRNASYHKEDKEHTVRLEHALDHADQDVIPLFIGHGGADTFLLEDQGLQDFADAE